MGEYAINQMMADYKRLTGIDADRSDFEDDESPRRIRPRCPKCQRRFSMAKAVTDHLRDKHGVTSATGEQP